MATLPSPHTQNQGRMFPPPPPLDPVLVTKQVEYYLSPLNLPYDRNLNFHLLPGNYISLYLITTFPRMQALNATHPPTVGRILREHAHFVNVDSSLTLVRPNWPYIPNPALWDQKPPPPHFIPFPCPMQLPPSQVPHAPSPTPFFPPGPYPTMANMPAMPPPLPLIAGQPNANIPAPTFPMPFFTPPVQNTSPAIHPNQLSEYHHPHFYHEVPNSFRRHLTSQNPKHPAPPFNKRLSRKQTKNNHKQGNADRRPYRRNNQFCRPAHDAIGNETERGDPNQAKQQQTTDNDQRSYKRQNHGNKSPASVTAMTEGCSSHATDNKIATNDGGKGEEKINRKEGKKLDSVQKKNLEGGNEVDVELPILQASDLSDEYEDVGAAEIWDLEANPMDESEGLNLEGGHESSAVSANAPRKVITAVTKLTKVNAGMDE